MADLVLRIPADVTGPFQTYWKDLRIAESLDPEFDLTEPVMSDKFDGATVAAWVVPIGTAVAPIITAVFGYMVAKRGELEIQKGDTTIKMKNLKPSQLKEFLAAIDEYV